MHEQVVAGYNQWAATYDAVKNETRDLEAECLQTLFAPKQFQVVLEMGCGTGKNSMFLQSICSRLFSFDASEEMLAVARTKVSASHVQFEIANLLNPWPVADAAADAVVFSLVLEHIENLVPVFAEAARVLQTGGFLYVGELHPFKQYLGSVARFERDGNVVPLPAYRHHLSEYLNAAKQNGFILLTCLEKNRTGEEFPRILALLFQKH